MNTPGADPVESWTIPLTSFDERHRLPSQYWRAYGRAMPSELETTVVVVVARKQGRSVTLGEALEYPIVQAAGRAKLIEMLGELSADGMLKLKSHESFSIAADGLAYRHLSLPIDPAYVTAG